MAGELIYELIYDVGVMDGADTGFYLAQGYRVVGIEASPVWAEKLRARFSSEIADGRFTLLNIAVSDRDGILDFWESEAPQWSSFDRELASRENAACRKIPVQTRVFNEVLKEHGPAIYCKIDIEGAENACLRTLTAETAPKYISVEMGPDTGDNLDVLASLGYAKFKVMSQVTRAQPMPLLTELGYALPAAGGQALRRIIKRTLGVRGVGGWRFTGMSSGPFGEQTPGPWRSKDQAYRAWRQVARLHGRYRERALGEWYDLHAAL